MKKVFRLSYPAEFTILFSFLEIKSQTKKKVPKIIFTLQDQVANIRQEMQKSRGELLPPQESALNPMKNYASAKEGRWTVSNLEFHNERVIFEELLFQNRKF